MSIRDRCSGCSGNPFKITDSFASYYAENKEEAGSDLEGMEMCIRDRCLLIISCTKR